MIKLTLYKGCRLNDSYKNVISQYKASPTASSPLEDYLRSLSPKEIYLDTVYQEDNTSFNFELEDTNLVSIYNYNYMKIETIDSEYTRAIITRYAFINSIIIKNDIGIINYKLDIWHSFVPFIIGLNKSYLSGLRVINDTHGILNPSYYNLPVEYASNNELIKDNATFDETDECNIIIELQMYTGSALGVQSYSKVKYVCLSHWYTLTNFSSNAFCNITKGNHIVFSDVEKIINAFLNSKDNKNIIDTDSSIIPQEFDAEVNGFYYDIGNIYIIPNISDKLENEIDGNALYGIVRRSYNDSIMGYMFNEEKLINIDERTFSNNFKRKSIGIINYQIQVINNGTSIPCKIECSISPIGFKIFLNTQNKYIDITENFKIEPLFTQANGDILAQQRIQRALANLNGFNSFINTGFSSGMGFLNAGLKHFHGDNMFGYYSNIVSEKGGQMGLLSGMTELQNANITGLGAGISLALGGAKLFENVITNNLPYYNSSSIVLANNIAILNCLYWICSFYINSENDKYVKESINNIGYRVYEYIDDLSKLGFNINPNSLGNIHYNIIQFGTCDVYGNFPLNIKKELDRILENGIKFWYYPNWSNDTYVVG